MEGLSKQGIEINVFDPYEKEREISPNIRISALSKRELPRWLSMPIYNLTRRIYYSKWYFNNSWCFNKGQEIVSRRLAMQIKSQIMDEGIQIIQCIQEETIPIALFLKKFVPVPVVVDMHNLAHLEHASAGLLQEGSVAYQRVSDWNRKLLHQVDLVIAVSDYMKEYMVSEYHLPEEKIIVVPPGGSTNRPIAVNSAGPPKVVYAGLAAYRENLELYIKSIPFVKAKRPDVQFYMSKKGEDFDRLMSLSNSIGAEVSTFWYEDVNDFYSFMQTCNISILPSSNDMARRIGTPLKLFDYLSLGLPIVCNDVGAWTEIIKKEKLGIVTESTPEAFAAGILQLLDNPRFASECGLRGKDLVKDQYNWDNSARRLAAGYEKLLGKPG